MVKKKKILAYFFCTLFLFSAFFCSAEEGRDLDIDYDAILVDAVTPTSTATSLPVYIIYVFQLIISISTALAILFLVIGGMRYLASAGDPQRTAEAKKQVLSVFFGLVLLLGSWLILNTVDNTLTYIEEPDFIENFEPSQGEERGLEVKYPFISEGVKVPHTVTISLPFYVIYIFWYLLYISGALATLFLTIGGMRYLASAGNPQQTAEAKKQVLSVFLGLTVLLGSWLILNTVNNTFTTLKDPELAPVPPATPVIHSGILLCEEEIENLNEALEEDPDREIMLELEEEIWEHCIRIDHFKQLTNYNFKAEQLYIIPHKDEDKIYGIMLYSGEKEDKARVVIGKYEAENYKTKKRPATLLTRENEEETEEEENEEWENEEGEKFPIYAFPFSLKVDPLFPRARTIRLYKYHNMYRNEDNPPPLVFEHDDDEHYHSEIIDLREHNYEDEEQEDEEQEDEEKKFLKIGSVEVDPPGTYVIFFNELENEETDYNNEIEDNEGYWDRSDDLWVLSNTWYAEDTKLQVWQEECKKAEGLVAEPEPYPCATHMLILSNFPF